MEEGGVEEQESENRGTDEESESQSNRAKDESQKPDNDIHVLLEDSDDEWIPGMLKN